MDWIELLTLLSGSTGIIVGILGVLRRPRELSAEPRRDEPACPAAAETGTWDRPATPPAQRAATSTQVLHYQDASALEARRDAPLVQVLLGGTALYNLGLGVYSAATGHGGSTTLILLGVLLAYMVFRLRNPKPSATRKSSFLIVAGSPEHAMHALLARIRKMRLRIVQYDLHDGFIEARRSFNWRTFGEVIRIEVGDQGDGTTMVRIDSDCSVRTTLVDYGANQRNITLLSAAVLEGGG